MEVVEAVVNRRYAASMVKDATGQKVPAGVKYPLRLEDKEEFKKRFHNKSPDACDACALAALAVKERFGLLPFGYIQAQQSPSALVPGEAGAPSGPVLRLSRADDYGGDAVGGDADAFGDTEDGW